MRSSLPLFLLFAATSLLGGRICAAHVEATFNAALTNETDWVYGSGVQIYKEGDYPYIRKQDGGFIASPNFGFAITSVTVEAGNSTANTSRKVDLTPIAPSGFRGDSPETYRLDLTEDPQKLTFNWSRESAVQALTIRAAAGGSGNVYFRSIVIDGASLTAVPTNLSVEAAYGDSFVARWENGKGICSNRLSVFRKDVKAFDFARAKSQPTSISADILGPGFTGENLYSATNADGVVQIGTSEKRGWLAYSDSETFRSRQLFLTVQRYPHKDEAKYMMLQWVRDGETNDIARVDLEDVPGNRTVSLSSVPDGATLLVSPPNRTTHTRILLSRFGFLSPVGEHVIPCSGLAGKRRFRVPGLSRNTDYFWTVSAFADDGTESPDSASVSARTNDLPPPGLVIRFR